MTLLCKKRIIFVQINNYTRKIWQKKMQEPRPK